MLTHTEFIIYSFILTFLEVIPIILQMLWDREHLWHTILREKVLFPYIAIKQLLPLTSTSCQHYYHVTKKESIYPHEVQPQSIYHPKYPRETRNKIKEEIDENEGEPFSTTVLRQSRSFSSCDQTGCSTAPALCHWRTSVQAAVSSEGRRGCTGSWPPWTELQVPGPGPWYGQQMQKQLLVMETVSTTGKIEEKLHGNLNFK